MSLVVQEVSSQAEFGSRMFWALLPIFLLVLALVGYALVDLFRSSRVRYLPKPVWALIIVLASAPLGALAYLVFGRTRHEADGDDPVSDAVPEPVSSTGRDLTR